MSEPNLFLPKDGSQPIQLCARCRARAGWRIDRRGDAVVAWSCDSDLAAVLLSLQRSWESSELVVELVVRVTHGERIGPPGSYPAGESWAP